MADKAQDRWTVRGVPLAAQRKASKAAKAQGITLGKWLVKAIEAALGQPSASPVPETSVTARLEALEARVKALEHGTGQAGPQTVVEAAGEPLEAGEALELVEAAGEAAGGPQKRRKWSETDFSTLRDIAARGGTQADACRELGRTSSDVNKYWKALGLPVQPRAGRKLVRRRM
jgi:hypothetical protein